MSIEKLKQWAQDGTTKRIVDAQKQRTPVLIKRSSGVVHEALIASSAGFGGLRCIVYWHDDGLEHASIDNRGDRVYPLNGTSLKPVDTVDIVDLNPWLSEAST